jgi:hypothetical protein
MGERLGTLKYRRSRWTQASAADDNVCFSSTSIPMAWTLSLRPIMREPPTAGFEAQPVTRAPSALSSLIATY